MAPTLHSGLIHYGGKFKSLVRGKQNIIRPHKEGENTPQTDFHEQGGEAKQDRPNPAPISTFSDLNTHGRNWWRGFR